MRLLSYVFCCCSLFNGSAAMQQIQEPSQVYDALTLSTHALATLEKYPTSQQVEISLTSLTYPRWSLESFKAHVFPVLEDIRVNRQKQNALHLALQKSQATGKFQVDYVLRLHYTDTKAPLVYDTENPSLVFMLPYWVFLFSDPKALALLQKAGYPLALVPRTSLKLISYEPLDGFACKLIAPKQKFVWAMQESGHPVIYKPYAPWDSFKVSADVELTSTSASQAFQPGMANFDYYDFVSSKELAHKFVVIWIRSGDGFDFYQSGRVASLGKSHFVLFHAASATPLCRLASYAFSPQVTLTYEAAQDRLGFSLCGDDEESSSTYVADGKKYLALSGHLPLQKKPKKILEGPPFGFTTHTMWMYHRRCFQAGTPYLTQMQKKLLIFGFYPKTIFKGLPMDVFSLIDSYRVSRDDVVVLNR